MKLAFVFLMTFVVGTLLWQHAAAQGFERNWNEEEEGSEFDDEGGEGLNFNGGQEESSNSGGLSFGAADGGEEERENFDAGAEQENVNEGGGDADNGDAPQGMMGANGNGNGPAPESMMGPNGNGNGHHGAPGSDGSQQSYGHHPHHPRLRCEQVRGRWYVPYRRDWFGHYFRYLGGRRHYRRGYRFVLYNGAYYRRGHWYWSYYECTNYTY
jgi:hypothetical protein